MTHSPASPNPAQFIETLPGLTVSQAGLRARQAGFFIAREDQLAEPERFRLDRVVVSLDQDGLVERAFVR